MTNPRKRLPQPTILPFDGEGAAIHTFETIMHRRNWCRSDLDVLISYIESTIFAETDRQKKHRDHCIEVRRHNAKIGQPNNNLTGEIK